MSQTKPTRAVSVRADLLLPQVLRLMRPLVVLLIKSGVTFPALAEKLRELFVSVADTEFALADKAQTDSRVSLLTGVHRKEVARLRGLTIPPSEASQTLSRSSQIISRWTSDENFHGKDGQPLPLVRSRDETERPSFEELVESVTKDVRPRAVLDDWLDQGIVNIEPDGLITLQQGAFLPRPGDKDQLYYFGRNLHDHISAAASNVRGGQPALFERAVHYDGLNESTAQMLTKQAGDAAMNILLDVNKVASGLVKEEPEGDWRWSLGVYVFREKTNKQEG